jgi:hypothetical protein
MDPKPRPLHTDDGPKATPSPHESHHVDATGEHYESEDSQGGLRDDSPAADLPFAGERRGCVARTRPHRRAELLALCGRIQGKKAAGGQRRPLGRPVWLSISTKTRP